MKTYQLRNLCLLFIMLISGWSIAQPGNGDCDCSGEEPLVCAINEDGDVVVLTDCLANCYEYEITACDSLDGDLACFDCLVNGEFDPVCAVDSLGNEDFYPNACFAECLGLEIVQCDTTGWGGDDCDCEINPGDYPVCVLDENSGETFYFPNFCFAACEGYEQSDVVDGENGGGHDDCDCDIDPNEEPICVLTDSALGIICPFPNLCYAECAGYSADDVVECDSTGGEFECIECLENDDFEAVCAITPDGDETFLPNACFAECLGYEIVECDTTGWGGNDCDCDIDPNEEPICVLTDSVLGIICPFPNLCYAECAGYSADDVVECDSTGGEFECIECLDDAFDLVCAVDSNGVVTLLPNACFAECFGLEVVECDTSDCFCPEYYDPVCAVDPLTLDTLTFDNSCFAECAGYTDWFGCDGNGGGNNCSAVCPEDVYDPVCVDDPARGTIEFQNACWAECAGYFDYYSCNGGGNDCEDACPDDYDPVCVTDSTGFTMMFFNSCLAECAGYTDYASCDDGGNDCEDACPDVQDPVCVESPNGEIIEFANPCLAECAGYFEFVDCETDSSGFAQDYNPLDNRMTDILANNITRDQINLTITSVADFETRLEVVSYQGHRLIQRDLHLMPGNNGIVLNMSGQVPGMYFVKIADVNKNHVIKVLLLD